MEKFQKAESSLMLEGALLRTPANQLLLVEAFAYDCSTISLEYHLSRIKRLQGPMGNHRFVD